MASSTLDSSLQRLLSMGFEYEAVLKALQNSNDEEEAIEILLNPQYESIQRKKRSHQSKLIDLDDIKEEEVINEYGKYHLTFGYCREMETLLHLYSLIPTEIKQLIHLYQLCETWDSQYSDANLILDASSIKKWNTKTLCTAFGSTVIGGKKKFVWKIRIKSSSDSYQNRKGYFAYIGIIKDRTVNYDILTDWKANGNGYAFNCGKAKLIVDIAHKYSKVTYGETFTKPGDTIQMTLDLKKRTISFMINGKDYGIAFENIVRDYYVFVISISNMVNNIHLEFF
eukprot:206776_1